MGVAAFAVGTWLFYAHPWPSIRDAFSPNARTQALPWRLAFDVPVDPPIAATLEPEQQVRQIYAALAEGDRAKALSLAGALSKQYPHFQLGQLLYADLLNISTRNPVTLPEVEEEHRPSMFKRLDELTLESRRRLNSPNAESLQGLVPAAVLFLSPQQTYVAAVDASKSRLYWFANQSTGDGPPRLQLIRESYISVGVNGVGKSLEGDGKTPTGVYFIQKKLPGESLPDLFGVGALTLNYPNALDLMHQKTGSGIWLHGTPSAQYARAPESTDGCVVLPNPEMQQLLQLPGLHLTPVVIADKLDWVPAAQQTLAWEEFKPVLNAWLAARNGTDAELLKTHYSERFERDNMGLSQWWPRLAQTTLGYRASQPLELISVLRWKDKAPTMVVTFKDPNPKASSAPQHLRTYWQKDNGQWKMVFQGPT